jgi:hypothetical protein
MNAKPVHSSRFSTAGLHNLASSILDRAKGALLIFCVVGFLLIEWHIFPAEWALEEGKPRQIILSLLVLLTAIVIFVIFDTHEEVEKISTNVAGEGQSSDRALNLIDSMKDLSNELNTVKRDDKVVMCHLALNLEQSWDYTIEHFVAHKNLRNMEVYLLMLPKDVGEIQVNPNHPVPHDVATWCKTVEGRLKVIDSTLQGLRPTLQRDGKRLKVLIKHYRMLPVIHGYSAAGRAKQHYVAFCRWLRNDAAPPLYWRYDWGENNYHKIVSDEAEPNLQDLANIFDGYFAYLWATSGDPSVEFYYGLKPDADHSKLPMFD